MRATNTDDERDRPTGTDSVLPDAGLTNPPNAVEYDVPAGSDPVVCPTCGRPFPDGDRLALHRGLVHDGELDDAERETVASARAAETRRLRLFRLRALIVLVVLYFGALIVYAVVV